MDALLSRANAKVESNDVFFKPKLYIPPSLSRNLKKTFFDSETSGLITEPVLVQFSGFKYCSLLDKSRFHLNRHVYTLGGSLAQMNPTPRNVMDLLDREALNIYEDIIDRMETANEEVPIFTRTIAHTSVLTNTEKRRPKGLLAIPLPRGIPPMRISRTRRLSNLSNQRYIFEKSSQL